MPKQNQEISLPKLRLPKGVKSYVLSNVATVFWGLSLLIGGIVFLIYFYSIGYMPEIGWSSATTLLIASTLTGAFFLFAIWLVLLSPSLFWANAVSDKGWLEPLYKHIRAPNQTKEALFFLAPNFAAFALLFLLIYLEVHKGYFAPYFFATVVLLSHFVACLLCWLWTSRDIYAFITCTIYLFILSFISIPLIFSLSLVLSLAEDGLLVSGYNGSPGHEFMLFFVILTCTIGSNSLFIFFREQLSLRQYTSLCIVVIFAITTMLGSWNYIPTSIMRAYRLGGMQNATLVLDETGCDTVRQHKLVKQDSSKTDTQGANSATIDSTKAEASPTDFCSIEASIGSRLGETYFLKRKIPKRDTIISFTIPEAHVLSWSVREPQADSTSAE